MQKKIIIGIILAIVLILLLPILIHTKDGRSIVEQSVLEDEQPYFYGKVIEVGERYIIVEPNEGEEERKSSDKISIGFGENDDTLYTVGTNVKITYNGEIMESYPAQIRATKIEIESFK